MALLTWVLLICSHSMIAESHSKFPDKLHHDDDRQHKIDLNLPNSTPDLDFTGIFGIGNMIANPFSSLEMSFPEPYLENEDCIDGGDEEKLGSLSIVDGNHNIKTNKVIEVTKRAEEQVAPLTITDDIKVDEAPKKREVIKLSIKRRPQDIKDDNDVIKTPKINDEPTVETVNITSQASSPEENTTDSVPDSNLSEGETLSKHSNFLLIPIETAASPQSDKYQINNYNNKNRYTPLISVDENQNPNNQMIAVPSNIKNFAPNMFIQDSSSPNQATLYGSPSINKYSNLVSQNRNILPNTESNSNRPNQQHLYTLVDTPSNTGTQNNNGVPNNQYFMLANPTKPLNTAEYQNTNLPKYLVAVNNQPSMASINNQPNNYINLSNNPNNGIGSTNQLNNMVQMNNQQNLGGNNQPYNYVSQNMVELPNQQNMGGLNAVTRNNQPNNVVLLNNQPSNFAPSNNAPNNFVSLNNQPNNFQLSNNQPNNFDVANNQPNNYGFSNNQPPIFVALNNQPNNYVPSNNQPNSYVISNNPTNSYVTSNNPPNIFAPLNNQPNSYVNSNNLPNNYVTMNNQPNHFAATNNQPTSYNNQPNNFAAMNNLPNNYVPSNYQPNNFAALNNQPNNYMLSYNQPNNYAALNNQPNQFSILNNQPNQPNNYAVNNQPNNYAALNNQPNNYASPNNQPNNYVTLNTNNEPNNNQPNHFSLIVNQPSDAGTVPLNRQPDNLYVLNNQPNNLVTFSGDALPENSVNSSDSIPLYTLHKDEVEVKEDAKQ